MSDTLGPVNRTFVTSDVKGYVAKSETVGALKQMVDELRRRRLITTSTGHLEQSNLTECLPYQYTAFPFRAWEYGHVFDVLRLRPGMRVLDCGGASSPLVFLCASRGIDIVTLDLQRPLVDNARHVAQEMGWELTAEVRDMTDTGYADDSFDAVFSISVLEHMTHELKARALREIGRIVRPGGLIGLTFDFGQGVGGSTTYAYTGRAQIHTPIGDVREIEERIVRPSGLAVYGNQPPFPARVDNDRDWIRRVWLSERITGSTPLADLVGVVYAYSPVFRSPYLRYTSFALFLQRLPG